jgi:hypothetical protein
MFGFRSREGAAPRAPLWVGERVDSLRRSTAGLWAALRAHDRALDDLANRLGNLERRDRAEAQRERRASQAAPVPVPVPAVPLQSNNGLTQEQVAALRGDGF